MRLFSTDSEADLRNIAKAAPGSKVYVRILTEGSTTADWPLSRKFGCQTDMAMDLMIMARDLGLVPYGVSFHVGSQQRDPAQWDAAVAQSKAVREAVRTSRQQVRDALDMLAGIGVLIFAGQFHVMLDDTPRGSGIANLLALPEAQRAALEKIVTGEAGPGGRINFAGGFETGPTLEIRDGLAEPCVDDPMRGMGRRRQVAALRPPDRGAPRCRGAGGSRQRHAPHWPGS